MQLEFNTRFRVYSLRNIETGFASPYVVIDSHGWKGWFLGKNTAPFHIDQIRHFWKFASRGITFDLLDTIRQENPKDFYEAQTEEELLGIVKTIELIHPPEKEEDD